MRLPYWIRAVFKRVRQSLNLIIGAVFASLSASIRIRLRESLPDSAQACGLTPRFLFDFLFCLFLSPFYDFWIKGVKPRLKAFLPSSDREQLFA